MTKVFRFVLALVVGLALLTWGASIVVNSTARNYSEKDIALRSQLVMSGARQAAVNSWSPQKRSELKSLLMEISHDERIMAAAACGADLDLLAHTADYPLQFSCQEIGGSFGRAVDMQSVRRWTWSKTAALPGGTVYVNAIPVIDGEKALGFAVFVHDFSYAERRETVTRLFLLVVFAVLAAAASLMTLLVARLSWRGWSEELRSLIKGGAQRPEFQPILQDVRELAERIASERESGAGAGAWTPQRLKQTVDKYVHGEKVVIVSNREPYIHQRREDGSVAVLHPASGLVTALEPVMRACSGVWIAHGSGSADRETADSHGRLRVPPGEESYWIRRVSLSAEEEKGYYYGFSNEGLWPLCHIAHARPLFRSNDWKYYQAVNQKFANVVCAEVDSHDPIVLVQDYHLALVPKLIRERLPHATVIMFWHIPWPNSERFGICPWREELLKGMLGSSLVGLQTQLHCNNFVGSVDRFLEARIDRERNAVVFQRHSTLVRPYPISVEWPVRWVASVPPAAECRKSVFAQLGLAPDALLGVGVDRLDYTKGIEERLLAVERLLERFPPLRGRFTFLELAAPSRTAIERYQQLAQAVEQLATRVNERFGSGDYRPIVVLRAHQEPPDIFRCYRAADVCYVSSLHDGMNLVAKEFVAARDDERGVLVLSHFTGAARELTEALIVNPYDIDEASSALEAALSMSVDEQRDRMRAMRAFVAEFNVYRWAGRMIADAARLRRQERLAGRLKEHIFSQGGSS